MANIEDLAASYQSMFDLERSDAHDVMNDLGAKFGYYGQNMYNPTEPNAASNAAYRCGQQSVLQYILHLATIGNGDETNVPDKPKEE